MTAETLLVAQTHHHNELRKELRTLSYNEERRRAVSGLFDIYLDRADSD